MKYRKLFFSCLAVIGLTSANAQDVVFNNHSQHNLNLYRNEHNVTMFLNAGTSVTLEDRIFKEMCQDQMNRCTFQIFKDFNSQEVITISFNNGNVSTISSKIPGVSVTGMGSTVDIENS